MSIKYIDCGWEQDFQIVLQTWVYTRELWFIIFLLKIGKSINLCLLMKMD